MTTAVAADIPYIVIDIMNKMCTAQYTARSYASEWCSFTDFIWLNYMLHFEVALACSDYRLVCLYRFVFIDAIEMDVTQCKCVWMLEN